MEAAALDDPDAALLARVAGGDGAAFRTLVAAKLPRIHALAQRLVGGAGEADDVAQEALLRAWRQAPNWQPGQARFDTWLHRVVLNLCYDRLRRRREVAVAEPPDQVDPSPDAEQRLLHAQTAQRVQAALARLPPRQREAILLHSYQDMSNIEAARVLGVSVEALESLLSRARRSLREHFEGEDQ